MSDEQELMQIETLAGNVERDWDALSTRLAVNSQFTKRQFEEAIKLVRRDPHPLSLEQAERVFSTAILYEVEPSVMGSAVWTLVNG